ncbi:MAG: hypothetical protein V3U96_06890 [Paracoccaceae bacterium]
MRTDIAIAYHLGAPHTDNEQLLWSLRKDAELLVQNGVAAPRPREYRRRLSDAVEKDINGEFSMEDREQLLSTLTNQQQVGRVYFSSSKFLGVQSWMFNNAAFYQNAGNRTKELRNLFPDNPCEFFLSIRNPATFVPEAYLGQNGKDYKGFIGDINIADIRWSTVIQRIQDANPDCPITVWCNEDTPIIWASVLREVAGLDANASLRGDLDIIRSIISPDGTTRLEQYLDERPALNEMQRRRVKAVFLEKFVVDDAVDVEIDLPGWTDETVAMMTETYEDDIGTISRTPGVNFISP